VCGVWFVVYGALCVCVCVCVCVCAVLCCAVLWCGVLCCVEVVYKMVAIFVTIRQKTTLEVDKRLPKSTTNRSDVLKAILGRKKREHRGARCKICEENWILEVFKLGIKSAKVPSARRFSRYLKYRI
jgi:hypothetical protein